MADFAQLFRDAADRFKAVPATLDPAEADRRVRRAEAAAARLACRAGRDGWLPFDFPTEAWPVEPEGPFHQYDDEPWGLAWRGFAFAAAMHSGGVLPVDLGDSQMRVVRDDREAGVRMLEGEYRPDGWQERAADYAALCRVLAESGNEPPAAPGSVSSAEPATWLSARDLARHFDLAGRQGALEKRLKRWRYQNGNGWMEIRDSDRRPRDPKFLYDPEAVREIIDAMKGDK